jgi:hypothetical protein
MRSTSRTLILLLLAAGVVDAATLILKLAWVEKFKDRATIEAVFTIDHAHVKPNAPAADGDMHVAGRAPDEIGLPMVAEIMNADNKQPAVILVHKQEGTDQSITVEGAWRLWFEHPPSAGSQTQFDDVPPAGNTNPDHCFEIHPLTKVGPNDVTASLHDIKGFTPKAADAAFGAYEKLKVSVKANKTAVSLTSNKTGYNYVLFTLHAIGGTTPLDDGGLAVLADVLPKAGETDETLAHNVRMIFVPGSDPFKRAQNGLVDGDELTVLGIPRINLNAVSAFVNAPGDSTATRKLPYEMIIVALEGPDAAASPAKGKTKKAQKP